MKLLICVVTALAVVHTARCQMTSSEEVMESVKLKILKDYLRERQAMGNIKDKVEAMCPGYGEKLEKIVVKMQACYNDIDEDKETMCSMTENHFERCAKPLTDMFEECLPEKSKEIPSFVIKSLLSITKQLCRSDGEHIFELSNQCVMSQNYRTKRCIRMVTSKAEQYKTKFASKSEVCELLNSVKSCFQSHLNFACGNEKTREAFLDLYDAAISPCKSNLNEIEIVEYSVGDKWNNNMGKVEVF